MNDKDFYNFHAALINDMQSIIRKHQLIYLGLMMYLDKIQNDPEFAHAECERNCNEGFFARFVSENPDLIKSDSYKK